MADIYDLILNDEEDPLDRILKEARRKGASPAKRTNPFPDLSEEEADSVAESLLRGGMGALQYFGETIDKTFGGRTVRSLLGGKGFGESLAHLIPFSDAMGLTYQDQAPTGRDLLEDAGILDENVAGFDKGDVAGFLAEVALDPATYLGIGALTKAGKEASKTGKLAGTLLENLDAEHRALAELRVPMLMKPGTGVMVGTGDTAKKVAKALDKSYDKLKFGTAAGRGFNALFDRRTRWLMGEEPQREAVKRAREFAKREAEAGIEISGKRSEAVDKFEATGAVYGQKEHAVVRNLLEFDDSITVGGRVAYDTKEAELQAIQELKDGLWTSYSGGKVPRVEIDPKTGLEFRQRGPVSAEQARFEHLEEMADTLRGLKDKYSDMLKEKGMNNSIINEFIAYFPRHHYKTDAPSFVQRAVDVYNRKFDEVHRGRRDFLTGIMTGTEGINRIVNKLAGWGRAGRAAWSLPRGVAGRITNETFPASRQFKKASDKIANKHRDIHRMIVEGEVAPGQVYDPRTDELVDTLVKTDADIGDVNMGWHEDEAGDLVRVEPPSLRKKPNGTYTWDEKYPIAKNPLREFAYHKEVDEADRLVLKAEYDQHMGIFDELAQEYGFESYLAAEAGTKKGIVKFAKWLNDLDPEKYVVRKEKFFNGDPWEDMILRGQQIARATTEAEMLTEIVKMSTRDFHTSAIRQSPRAMTAVVREAGEEVPGYQPLGNVGEKQGVLSQAGFDVFAGEKSETGLWIKGAERSKIYEKLGVTPEQLKGLYVPNEVAADLTRYVKSWSQPEELGGLMEAYDLMLQTHKKYLTQIWPAFHARNWVSATYYNLIAGAHLGGSNPFKIAKSMVSGQVEAADMIAGKITRNTKTDKMLMDMGIDTYGQLFDELTAHGVAFGENQALETIEMAYELAEAGAGNIKQLGKDFKSAAATKTEAAAKAARELLNIPGETRLGQAANIPAQIAKAGQKVGATTEDVVRISHYLARRRQGYEAVDAAMSTKKWHFDYTARGTTEFERKFMKRVIPFYLFMRRNTPLVLEQIAKNPGGAIAQSIRASNVARQESEFVPGYIGEGFALQLNDRDFLSGTGLPFEEPFERAVAPKDLSLTGIGDATSRTLQKFGASMAPAPKLLAEMTFQKNLFTGEDFNDMYPSPTTNPFVNALIQNSPASRFVSSGRKIMDDRKSLAKRALNMGTGLKISTARDDLDKLKRRRVIDLFRESVRKNPRFDEFSIPYAVKDERENLTDEERMMMRLYRTLDKEIKAERRAGN